MSGFVSLVGAGPGDPDLLTCKAAERLRGADLILYDALVSPAVLALAPRVQRFCVGKRAGRHSIEQAAIHRLMIRAARRGRRVVRLKCGDPFVLGRGGEEAQALAAAGVAFEVVPGLTAALAAPALSGIPVTHRGLAPGFVVLSGHAEDAYRAVLDSLAPNALTLVVLMGLRSRASLACLLLARGWRPSTPSAMLFAASTPRSAAWLGPLELLGAAPVPPEAAEAPVTIVVGDVVSLAEPARAGTGQASTLAVGRSG
jgi:uroporphyrin-III C-methyltransferase/precorrin-2 dehydrogenase/sirohydrochlorin ferrochelatase